MNENETDVLYAFWQYWPNETKTLIIMQLNNYIYETLVSLYMINYGAKQACSSDVHLEGGLSHADRNIFSYWNHSSIIVKTCELMSL